MKTVSRFESRLLQLAEFFVGRSHASAAAPALLAADEEPSCLSRSAVEALQDRLAKGTVGWLVREGGWRHESFLRDGVAREGPVWKRSSPESLGLRFTGESMRFLLWATARDGHDQNAGWERKEERSIGDDLLLFLAYRAVRSASAVRMESLLVSWRRLEPFRASAFVRLFFPLDQLIEDDGETVDFGRWFVAPGDTVLECLQDAIAEAWIEAERRRREIVNPVEMRHASERIERILTGFLDAAERSGRRDLARCLLVAMRRWSFETPEAVRWSPNLAVDELRLSDRLRHRAVALAFPRAFLRTAAWLDRARATTIVDDDYPAARALRSDWERLAGDRSRTFAERLLQDAERGAPTTT